MKQLWLRHRALFLFCVSGTLALGVDIGVLSVLRSLWGPDWGTYGGRLVSFWAAATCTWSFNRRLTFVPQPGQARRLPIGREYLQYLGSMAVGGALNYGSYALAVTTLAPVRAQPAWGVALGSLVGLAFNFMSARRILAR
jgi:putative flippase GtrA